MALPPSNPLWNPTQHLWDYDMQGGFGELSKGRGDPVPDLFPFTTTLQVPRWHPTQDRMTKDGTWLAETQTQAGEMWCYSANKNGLEKVPGTILSFIPKWAQALQSSTTGPSRGTPCDMCDTAPLLAGDEELCVAGCEPTSFSWPRGHQALNLAITMFLWSRPAQAIHRANTSSTAWGHLHHSCCLQGSCRRGWK